MKRISLLILLYAIKLVSFSQNKNLVDDGRIIRIPVVFHIIYATDSENIQYGMINNELYDLNLDFSAKNDISKILLFFEVPFSKNYSVFYISKSMKIMTNQWS